MDNEESRGGKALSNDEIVRIVASRVLEDLEECLDARGYTGMRFPYSREGRTGDLPDNVALLTVERDGKGEVTVSVGVSRDGTDRLYSNYLFEAGNTLEEVRAWLGDADACAPVIMASVRELSDSVDEYWD